MNRAFSLYIDGLRAGAALIVLLSHFAYLRFTDGRYIWIRDYYLGSDAVVIFFVLSGFVIAFCAQNKKTTLGSFVFARATRFFSVALPALLIGYVLDSLGAAMFPQFYAGQFYNPIALWTQLASGLSFSNEWTGLAVRLGSNGPYWSLSYEVAYYALFAVVFFLSGLKRWLLLTPMCILFGVNVLLLLPCWLMGVWVYLRLNAAARLSGSTALLMAVVPLLIYISLQAGDIRHHLTSFMLTFLSPGQIHDLRFSDAPIWDFILACLTAVHLLGTYGLLQHRAPMEAGVARSIRYIASSSFSIYLFHYPLLQFLKPLTLTVTQSPASDIILLGVTLIICLAFAAIFERTLKQQRKFAKRLIRSVSAPSH